MEYLFPCVPELKIKDYDIYRAFCCGLCSQLKEQYGFYASCRVNRDMVLFALLADGLAGREGTVCGGHCIRHAVSKAPMMCHTQGIRIAAMLNVILEWHLKLGRSEERGIPPLERLHLRMQLACLRGAFTKAAAEGAQIERILLQEWDQEQALVHRGCKSYEALAEPYSNIFSALFVYCAPDPSSIKALRRAGGALGRIYFLLCEIERFPRDARTGGKNVFLQNGLTFPAARENAKYQCNLAAAELAAAYNLLNIKLNRALLDNLVFLGLEEAVAAAGESRKIQWREI